MERRDLEELIRDAFAGVRLGYGVSLRQAAAIDVDHEGLTPGQFDRLPEGEVTDDWTSIPDEELARDNIAHLDPEGLRYYLPALMLWLLDHYGDADARLFDTDFELTVDGTIGAIAPEGLVREHQYRIFDIHFTEQQRRVIAAYVESLPGLVELNWRDAEIAERSVRDYWGQYLPRGA